MLDQQQKKKSSLKFSHDKQSFNAKVDICLLIISPWASCCEIWIFVNRCENEIKEIPSVFAKIETF
jgi:hypothetical protein